MSNKPTYHIDVTEEENNLFRDVETAKKERSQVKTLSLKKAFVVVLSIHALGVAALFGVTQKGEKKSNVVAAQPTPIPPSTSAPITAATSPSPSPNPTPALVQEVIATSTPTPEIVSKVSSNSTLTAKPTYTREYTIKSGDNFYRIVKKFKLNPQKLIELNNIKDVNKLQVGQTLKFMK